MLYDNVMHSIHNNILWVACSSYVCKIHRVGGRIIKEYRHIYVCASPKMRIRPIIKAQSQMKV